MSKIELLAPAGNIENAKTAINCGADAIYLGGKMFGARSSAPNFTEDELVEIVEYAHIRGVFVYVTVNTIVFDSEIAEAIKFLDFLYLINVDAVILQDIGLAFLVKERYPNLPMHASTQMSVVSVKQAQTLKDLGFTRIICARELELEKINEIATKVDIEIEAFVHGALCMSYSGNCYLSSFNGGRSGNRGKCAQPCRLCYGLESQNETYPEKYYLSPKDLCSIDYLDKLIESKVTSLKIEGRMKRQEYVAQVVKDYKAALNKKYNGNRRNLQLAFNRGFTKGYLNSETNANLTNVEQSNHIGIKVGEVVASNNQLVTVKLEDEIFYGDSLRLVGKTIDAITINQMYTTANKLITHACKGSLVVLKAHKQDLLNAAVYLTSSEKQKKDLLDFANSNDEVAHKIDIDCKCFVKSSHLVLVLSALGYTVSVKTSKVETTDKDFTERIIAQIKKTNNRLFVINNIEANLKGYYIPIKEINALRREAIDELQGLILYTPYENRRINKDLPIFNTPIERLNTCYIANVVNEEQLLECLKYDIDINVSDYKLYKKYQSNTKLKIRYNYPRVARKHTEVDDCVLNQWITGKDMQLGQYGNVANAYSVWQALNLGFTSVMISPEVSLVRLKELLYNVKRLCKMLPNLGYMVYGRYQLMISRHCLINKVFDCKSKGCMKCKDNFKLTDSKNTYLLQKDEMCNLLVLSSNRLWLLDYISQLEDLGINQLLLDFTTESAMEVADVLDCYLNQRKGIIEDATIGHFLSGEKI